MMVARTPGSLPPPCPPAPFRDLAPGAGLSETERDLRRLLCLVYAGASAYMDDGEASDSREHPGIDFMRDSPKDILMKMQQRSMKKLQNTQL